jgi:hypothetical protein
MKYLVLLAVAFASGCGGASYTATGTAAVPTPVADVFGCLRQQLQAIGFQQTSIDTDDHRLNARRNDDTVRRPDVRFRRMVDVLEMEVRSDASGQTALVVEEKTFAEYFSERGPTLQQEAASERVRTAGQVVLDACGH